MHYNGYNVFSDNSFHLWISIRLWAAWSLLESSIFKNLLFSVLLCFTELYLIVFTGWFTPTLSLTWKIMIMCVSSSIPGALRSKVVPQTLHQIIYWRWFRKTGYRCFKLEKTSCFIHRQRKCAEVLLLNFLINVHSVFWEWLPALTLFSPIKLFFLISLFSFFYTECVSNLSEGLTVERGSYSTVRD